MNTKNIVFAIQQSTKIPAKDVDLVLRAFIDEVSAALERNESVRINRLGTFTSKLRRASTRMNSFSNQPIEVKEKNVVRFKGAAALNRQLNNGEA